MGFSLLIQNTLDLWKEWEMRLLVLLSLFFQLILATQVSQRKYKFRIWIHVMVWTAFTLADSITNLALSIFSNRLANIQGRKETIDPKTQITALWAPFLLLHLGGPDTITAFVKEDNELWLRQFLRLCIQVGLMGFIYYMALLGSTLSTFAMGMTLVGLMKYAERILCLYLASKGKLREWMFLLPDFGPVHSRILQQYTLKEEEGYRVEIDQVCEVPAWEDVPEKSDEILEEKDAASDQKKKKNAALFKAYELFKVFKLLFLGLIRNSGDLEASKRGETLEEEKDAASDPKKEKDAALFKAYELFKVFKLLFLGLIRNSGDLEASKRMFMKNDMNSKTAFMIVKIELGLMYDLLYTKAPLLNYSWGIIRWVISLSVPGAVLVFFSLQDKKDYAKVDMCITFLLISVAILLEIYSLLLAISSDWVDHWRLQRPARSAISSTMAFLHFSPNHRWSNSVAQISLLGLSMRKINRIFLKCPMLAKLDEKLVIFYIAYANLNNNIQEWIFSHMKDTIKNTEPDNKLKNLKEVVSDVLQRSDPENLMWSVEGREFDQIILIWHIATELCYYRDRNKMKGLKSPIYRMSKLVSRYLLYLLVLHPSMLPTGIGVLRYKDTLVDAQKFLESRPIETSKKQGRFSSVVIEWVKKLFKNKGHFHTGVQCCEKGHKSRESHDLCELCHLLLDNVGNMPRGGSRSVLFDACYLATQLNDTALRPLGDIWDLIGKVWANLLIHAAYQCKDHEHCGSLSRGGELLTHIWLLMAHLGFAEAVDISNPRCAAKLIKN